MKLRPIVLTLTCVILFVIFAYVGPLAEKRAYDPNDSRWFGGLIFIVFFIFMRILAHFEDPPSNKAS